MIKTIKIFLFIWLLSILSNISIEAMEKPVITSQDGATFSDLPIIPSKSHRKRANRKKSKKNCSKLENIVDNLEDTAIPDPKVIKYFIENSNLLTILHCNDDSLEAKIKYIDQLNFFANIIIIQKWLLSEFEQIKKLAQEIAVMFNADKTTCLSVADDGIGICGHAKDELGEDTTKIIQHPIVKMLIVKITAPILLGPNCTWSEKNYQQCCKVIEENKNADFYTFASYTKKLMDFFKLQKKFKNINQRLNRLKIDIICKLCLFMGDSITDLGQLNAFEVIVQKHLADAGMEDGYNQIIPYFNLLCHRFFIIYQTFTKDQSFFNSANINQLLISIEDYMKWWDPVKDLYDSVYDKILSTQNKSFKTIPNCYFHKKMVREAAKDLFSNLKDHPAYESGKLSSSFIPHVIADEVRHSFIDDLPEINKKSEKQDEHQKVKRKRNRRRRKMQNPEKDIEKEESESILDVSSPSLGQKDSLRHIKLPVYADRVIARFNQNFNYDLYHTYSPITDPFIILYGTKKTRPNKTFHDQTDTQYSISGKIEDNEGFIIFGEFSITLDEHKICYHRQFVIPKTEDQSPALRNILFEADCPALSSEIHVSSEDGYISARLHFNVHYDAIYGQKSFCENSRSIVIKDERNKVTITLFKTDNNNTIN